jgi:type III restriction enzyme
MNKTGQMITQRLSLRTPQAQSLEILADIVDEMDLSKSPDLNILLEEVHDKYGTCTNFERDFLSICFALATGVGKTRLMGAFISYLSMEKGISNFFVLAPNLTVYNKLIDDLSNPASSKYVFKGIADFAQNPPRIITGDNYNTKIVDQARYARDLSSMETININIFNISKLNAETRSGKEPKMKRLSEYLGESYFQYLMELKDLVLIMDESHHYRADRGMAVLNELNPVLGLELTATPQVQQGATAIKFKNVVFDYPLGRAMKDGYVKEPTVVTRKDFDPSQYTPVELDWIKLEDGIRIHENVKPEIDIYCRNNNLPRVKPFVLVVAKDTTHAGQLIEMIKQSYFFDGYYADKVLEIHSNQRGSEKDENIQQLLQVEDPDNSIEIVIHVNILKEGWDVTNLYTIIPLRTSASATLTEQTMGRGLRLPFGKRMNDDAMDKLYIVSHDKFQAIIEEANKPDSLINTTQIVDLGEMELEGHQEVITVGNNLDEGLNKIVEDIENADISPEEKKKRVFLEVDLVKKVSSYVHTQNTFHKTEDLKKKEVEDVIIERVLRELDNRTQKELFDDQEEIISQVKAAIQRVYEHEITSSIKIPRISIVPEEDFEVGFRDFDLDTQNLRLSEISEDLHEKVLTRKEGIKLLLKGGHHREIYDHRDIIVNELINYNEVDYDEHADLLYKLSGQALESIKAGREQEAVNNIIWNRKKNIAEYIYTQMKPHFFLEAKGFRMEVSASFSAIRPHNMSKIAADQVYLYSDTIEPASRIKSCVFSGFKKSCHSLLKFDSKSEKDFAFILEEEAGSPVLKWLRPAPNQFNITWGVLNPRQYEPDFVAETADTIYLIEVKAEKDILTADVQDKAKAAVHYCKHATAYNAEHGEKPWKYILIPHDKISIQMGFESLSTQFEIAQ